MARYIDADALIECIDIVRVRSPHLICFSKNEVKNMIDQQPAADVVPKSEVDQLKKALEAQDAEYSQALHDKAREYNMVVDKICLEHRAEYARLHEAHQEELAKAKREVARKVIAEVNLLVSKYSLEPNYSMGQMEIDLSELEKKYTKGATDGKSD